MARRMWRFGLVVGIFLGGLSGCTGAPLAHRSRMREQAQMEAPPARAVGAGDVSEAADTADLSREARGFFKPGRRSGALSREAAEVEADLGVPR